MHRLALLIASLLVIGSAHARDFPLTPVGQCEFMHVVGILQYESLQRAGVAAEQSLPLLKKLEFINAKAKRPGVPVQEQLSGPDIAEFARLSQQVQASMLSQLIESHRERDLRVLAQFVRLADQEYRWGMRLPAEADLDYMPYVILAGIREALPRPQITEPDARMCTMDYALHQISLPAIEAFNRLTTFSQHRAVMDRLTARYHDRPLDPAKMAPVDAAAFKAASEVFTQARRHTSFVLDIERLKLMARAADLNAQAKGQDLMFAGGDIRKVGSTLDAMMARKELDQQMQTALKVWFIVNEKIPSEVSNSLGNASASGPK